MKNHETTEEVTISRSSPNDILGIRNVWYETWLDTYPNKTLGITVEDIEDRFKDYFTPESLEEGRATLKKLPENEVFFVAKIDQEVVGFCRVVSKNGKNRIRAFYVLPDTQGRGIGTRLWEAVRGSLELENPTYVDLADYNKGAQAFYEKIGFEDTGKRWSDPELTLASGVSIPEMEMVLGIE